MLNFPHGMLTSEMDIKNPLFCPVIIKIEIIYLGEITYCGDIMLSVIQQKTMIRERKSIIVWLLPYHN